MLYGGCSYRPDVAVKTALKNLNTMCMIGFHDGWSKDCAYHQY